MHHQHHLSIDYERPDWPPAEMPATSCPFSFRGAPRQGEPGFPSATPVQQSAGVPQTLPTASPRTPRAGRQSSPKRGRHTFFIDGFILGVFLACVVITAVELLA